MFHADKWAENLQLKVVLFVILSHEFLYVFMQKNLQKICNWRWGCLWFFPMSFCMLLCRKIGKNIQLILGLLVIVINEFFLFWSIENVWAIFHSSTLNAIFISCFREWYFSSYNSTRINLADFKKKKWSFFFDKI
jgi:hypothetical protein